MKENVQLSISITGEMNKQLKLYSIKNNTSQKAVVINLLSQALGMELCNPMFKNIQYKNIYPNQIEELAVKIENLENIIEHLVNLVSLDIIPQLKDNQEQSEEGVEMTYGGMKL